MRYKRIKTKRKITKKGKQGYSVWISYDNGKTWGHLQNFQTKKEAKDHVTLMKGMEINKGKSFKSRKGTFGYRF